MAQLLPKMRLLSIKFGDDEQGATAIEYGLMVAGVAIAILATVFAMGSDLSALFDHIGSAFASEARCVEVGSNCTK